MTKSDKEIMDIYAAFDLTRCPWSAAQLAGCDPRTVERWVAIREAGGNPFERPRRPRLIDPFLEKIEELVERSSGKIRADVVHDRHIVPMGFAGDERTTRRAVAEAKEVFLAGRRRTYRPWIPEPGMWLQFDWGDGPEICGRKTCLFCVWLAWSRFRVVIPTWDRTMGTLLACLDAMLRRVGAAPTYALTDNERTVTTGFVAGIPLRHAEIVAAGRHYLLTELHHANTQVRGHVGDPPTAMDLVLDNRLHDQRTGRAGARPGRCGRPFGRPVGRHRRCLGALSACRPGRVDRGGGVDVVR